MSLRFGRFVVVAMLCLGAAVGAAPPATADVAVPLPSPTFQSTGDEMVAYNGYLYFAADDGTHGNELWRTDGTPDGTTMVADLDTNGSSGNSNPYRLTVVGGRLFFNVVGGGGALLYVYDGSGVPQPITVEANGSVGYIMGSVGSTLLAVGYINHHIVQGRHVVRAVTSGATNAVVVGGGLITPDSTGSRGSFSTETGGWLYFWGSNSTGSGVGAGLGPELYRTNGTTTELVEDIGGPGTAGAPYDLTTVGNLVFFTAITAAANRELWRTDGTEAGTFMVKEHVPGSGSPAFHEFAAHGGRLYYSVSEPVSGHELWTSDGTAAGTGLVKDIVPGAQGSGPAQLTSAGSRLFFRTNSAVWVTDGTDAGTQQLVEPRGDGYGPSYLTAADDRLYFRAGSPWGSVAWRSDGTPAGTFPVTAGAYDPAPGSGNPATGAIGVLGTKVILTSRFPGDPLRTEWRRLTTIDRAAADPVRAATVAPALTGTPAPGQTLSVDQGSWTLAPGGYAYQWFRNGQPIANATGTSLLLGAGDLGATIHATVTTSGLAAPPATAATAPVTVTTTGLPTNPGGGGGTRGGRTTAKPIKLGRLTAKASRTRQVTLTLRPTAAGRVTVTGRIKVGRRAHTVLAGNRTATRAGVLKVQLKPNRAGRRYLERGKQHRVTLRVTLTPRSGKAVRITRTLRVKIPQ